MRNETGYSAILSGMILLLLACLVPAPAFAQKQPETAAERVRKYFEHVNKQVLDMARDFPENKYDFRLTKEMRSFGDVIVHVASGNIYGVKAGRGEKANWDELDPKNYAGKSAIVDLLRKSTLTARPC